MGDRKITRIEAPCDPTQTHPVFKIHYMIGSSIHECEWDGENFVYIERTGGRIILSWSTVRGEEAIIDLEEALLEYIK